jgi:hypothetical protein
MKTKRNEIYGKFGLTKLEMSSVTGSGPAPSTLNTENIQYTGAWWQISTLDRQGDSYPDDCCE